MDMTLEQQGAYRNLLDEAALRGGTLPNDERILAKASGDALRWADIRPVVIEWFKLRADGWHNDTLDEVLAPIEPSADLGGHYTVRGELADPTFEWSEVSEGAHGRRVQRCCSGDIGADGIA